MGGERQEREGKKKGRVGSHLQIAKMKSRDTMIGCKHKTGIVVISMN